MRLKKPDASTEDVLATRTFATGDKFQLGLKVNRPSFVYIFNEEPGGRISMLHPRPGGTRNGRRVVTRIVVEHADFRVG